MPASRLRWILLVLVALFVWGVVAMINMAMSRSSIYGDHSTLRADPLGAKALYETLAAIPGLRVERNLRRASRLAGAQATVFWIGEESYAPLGWNKEQLAAFEAMVRRGGRLVIGVLPAGPDDSARPTKTPGMKKGDGSRVPELELRWQIQLRRDQASKAKRPTNETLRQTALWLQPSTGDWRCLEGVAPRCLAAERTFGTGTIVITLETFSLSNEGLRKARRPDWIATLVGPWRRVIFDEAHLGVEETGSMGTLIRQFRLEAAALMLVALAGLFIWRNSSSLLPPLPPAPDLGLAADPHRSMVLLLRRGIAPAALTATCLDEWQRAAALLPYRHRRRLSAAIADARAATTPASAWQRVRQALLEKS